MDCRCSSTVRCVYSSKLVLEYQVQLSGTSTFYRIWRIISQFPSHRITPPVQVFLNASQCENKRSVDSTIYMQCMQNLIRKRSEKFNSSKRLHQYNWVWLLQRSHFEIQRCSSTLVHATKAKIHLSVEIKKGARIKLCDDADEARRRRREDLTRAVVQPQK